MLSCGLSKVKITVMVRVNLLVRIITDLNKQLEIMTINSSNQTEPMFLIDKSASF